jgi:hypothetical protein
LASLEYFKAAHKATLKKSANIIDIEFKDFKNGKYKIISFFAKKARGMMAKYIVQNRIANVEDLKGFNDDGYSFDEKASDTNKIAFKRG